MRKIKKLKTKISLIAIAIIIILITLFSKQLSTNNPDILNNLKNFSNTLASGISNDIDLSISNSISNFISTTFNETNNSSKNNIDNSSTQYVSGNSTTNISEKLYKVTRVVDGDTIIIDYNGTEERVRLIGIDTPESVHPNAEKNTEFGKIASNFTKEKLENKHVKIELDVQERDKYGRILAYVYIDDVMYNKTLLKEGYAKIATYPPNIKYVDNFTEIQKEAKNNKKGLWGIE